MTFEFSVFDAYCDGDNLWFTAVEYNALYRKSLHDNKVEYIGSFPGEEFLQWRLYTSVCQHGKKLYFTPGAAKEIGVYDMELCKFYKIPIGISKEENDISKINYLKKFISAFVVDNRLIMLPCCYNKTMVVDLLTWAVRSDTAMYDAMSEKYDDEANYSEDGFYFCWTARMVDSHTIVFDLHKNKNVFIVYELSRNTWKVHSTGNLESSYAYCEYAAGKVWLYDDKRMVLDCCNLDGEMYETYRLPRKNVPALFSTMFEHKGGLYFLPADGGNVIRFSIDDRIFEEVSTWKDSSRFFSNMVVAYDDTLYLFDVRRKGFFACRAGAQEFLPCMIEPDSMKRLKYKLYEKLAQDNKGIVFEYESFSLEDCLQELQCSTTEECALSSLVHRRNYGREIWKGIGIS